MNTVSTLASHNFLDLEKVLDADVGDVFAYLCYLTAKNRAEMAEHRFQEDRIKAKHKRR